MYLIGFYNLFICIDIYIYIILTKLLEIFLTSLMFCHFILLLKSKHCKHFMCIFVISFIHLASLIHELKHYSCVLSTYHRMYTAQDINGTMIKKIDTTLLSKKLRFKGRRIGFLEEYIGNIWY